MKTKHKLVLALLAGVSLGIAGAGAIRAQQVKAPPAYIISEVFATDPNPAALKEYREKAPAILASFNGRYLARGGKTQSLEGDPPKSIVILAFDSVEKAREWYDSPAYAAIRPLRQNSTKSRLYIVEGVTPSP